MTRDLDQHSRLEEHWQPSADTVSQGIGGDIVLVHLRTGQIYELNATGARIWELLSEGCGQTDIVRQLLQEYEVSEAEAHAQLGSLLDTLIAARLVRAKTDD